MIAWTINDLYLACAAVLLTLSWLLLASRRNFLVWQFVLATVGLSIWNICTFIMYERIFPAQVSLVDRVQLVAILWFGTGLFNFCSSFPENRANPWQLVTALISLGFTLGLLFTREVSDAVMEGDAIRYIDRTGFYFYTAYICLLALLNVGFLVRSWLRHPEQRGKITVFIAAVSTFVIIGSLFNLVLPAFGNYELLIVGRMSSTLTVLLFFFAIAKHEFLDVNVIINKQVAWAVTLLVLCALGLLLQQLAGESPVLETLAITLTAAVAALSASSLQQFLLTTAKRKFIKGWYEPEEVIKRLSAQITQETSRESIFRKTLRTLDEVFELEDTLSIVAMRDQSRLVGYRIQEQLKRLSGNDPLLSACKDQHAVVQMDELAEPARNQLQELLPKLDATAVVLPFHSPEHLEGVLVLGSKSSGAPYSAGDLVFLNNLINYMAPLLYRLTPLETLERLYNEHQRKLHESEIQLLRAQKIESIVHATRQCHHEIRTPLNIIKLGLGRIKTLEELENYKRIAREEIDHAIHIVEETLAITDSSAAAIRKFVSVDLNEVVRRCLRLIDLDRYSVVLDLQEVPAVRGIFSDLQVVLTNLIHNAMEAMPQGGTLSFTTRLSNGMVQLRIEDTGEGISPENRNRVWEPYFSGKGGMVGNSSGGRGWGLTIVNRIISEHKGTIVFESEVGVGTRFILTLPALAAPVEASNVVPAAARA